MRSCLVNILDMNVQGTGFEPQANPPLKSIGLRRAAKPRCLAGFFLTNNCTFCAHLFGRSSFGFRNSDVGFAAALRVSAFSSQPDQSSPGATDQNRCRKKPGWQRGLIFNLQIQSDELQHRIQVFQRQQQSVAQRVHGDAGEYAATGNAEGKGRNQ
jgi:hypothetical protein